MRSTTRYLAVTASLLLVLALSGVAAGATQTATPKKWVSVFCGSTLVLEQTITKNVAGLNKSLSRPAGSRKPSVSTLKRRLVAYLSAIVYSTSATTAKIKAVGPPAISSGSKLQSAVLSGFGVVHNGFAHTLNAAKKLPTKGAKQFSAQTAALAKTLQADANRIRAAFVPVQKYLTNELNDALRQDASCKKLGSG